MCRCALLPSPLSLTPLSALALNYCRSRFLHRAPQSKSAYESIGGGSPIVSWTNAQAKAIASQLEGKGLSGTKCYVGMRYWHPFTEAALEAIEKDGVNALVSCRLHVPFGHFPSSSRRRLGICVVFARPSVEDKACFRWLALSTIDRRQTQSTDVGDANHASA